VTPRDGPRLDGWRVSGSGVRMRLPLVGAGASVGWGMHALGASIVVWCTSRLLFPGALVTCRCRHATRCGSDWECVLDAAPNPVQGAWRAHQAGGVRHLRRSHAGEDAEGSAHAPGVGVPVRGARLGGVPDAQVRSRFRAHPDGHLEGERLPDPCAQSRVGRASGAPQRAAAAAPRPGSYSWPALRRRVEQEYAHGATPAAVAPDVHVRYADAPATPPSRRTIQRWHHQRRWLTRPP
jgi:hypothetical protein